MAIINQSHQFIFVHVPMSAGTSVTNALSSFTGVFDVELGGTEYGERIASPFAQRFGIGKHATSVEIQHLVGNQIWNEYFIFGFVRNPYSRVFSIYRFLKTKFRKWKGSEIMDVFGNFDEFVRSDFFSSRGQIEYSNLKHFG